MLGSRAQAQHAQRGLQSRTDAHERGDVVNFDKAPWTRVVRALKVPQRGRAFVRH